MHGKCENIIIFNSVYLEFNLIAVLMGWRRWRLMMSPADIVYEHFVSINLFGGTMNDERRTLHTGTAHRDGHWNWMKITRWLPMEIYRLSFLSCFRRLCICTRPHKWYFAKFIRDSSVYTHRNGCAGATLHGLGAHAEELFGTVEAHFSLMIGYSCRGADSD